ELDELLGVPRLAVHDHLVVNVGTRGAARAPEQANLRMCLDPLAHRDGITMHVTVESGDSVSGGDLDDLAVCAAIPGIGDGPRWRGVNRGHIGGVKVQPGMDCRSSVEWIAARTEPASNLIPLERRRQG